MILYYLNNKGAVKSVDFETQVTLTEPAFVIGLVNVGVRSTFVCQNNSLTPREVLATSSPLVSPKGILLSDYGPAGRVVAPVQVNQMFAGSGSSAGGPVGESYFTLLEGYLSAQFPIRQGGATPEYQYQRALDVIQLLNARILEITEVPDPTQIKRRGPYATIVSPYIVESSSVLTPFDVDFNYHYLRGSDNDPIHGILKLKLEGQENVTSTIYHSSEFIPAELVDFREPHERFYITQAHMLSDQVNQIVGKNYVLLNTFYRFQPTGAPTGTLADYQINPTGREHGKKEPWLIFTHDSDTYLEGVQHLNKLELTYKKYHKHEGVLYHDAVLCKITNIPNGNLAVTKPDLRFVGNFQMQENPTDIASLEELFLNDDSIYSALYEAGESGAYVVRPQNLNAVVDTGGGDLGYDLVKSGVSSSLQSFIEIKPPVQILNQFSLVIKVRKKTGTSGGSPSLSSNLAGSSHLGENSGGIRTFFSSAGAPRLSIGVTAQNGGQISANEIRASDSNLDSRISTSEFRTFIFMFDGTRGYIYRNNGVDYANSNQTTFAGRIAGSKHPIRIGRNIDGSTTSDFIVAYAKLYLRTLSLAEIQAQP